MLRSFHFSLTVNREPKLIDKEQAGRNYELGMKRNLFYFKKVFILFLVVSYRLSVFRKTEGRI